MVSKLVTSRSIWRSALLISLVACGATPRGGEHRSADLVLLGGGVRTMDLAHPPATAVAGGGGRGGGGGEGEGDSGAAGGRGRKGEGKREER